LTYQTVEKSELRAGIPLNLPEAFFAEARVLRAKLLKWRFDNFRRFCQLQIEGSGVACDLRLNQITGPLYAVSSIPEFNDELQQFTHNYSSSERSLRPQAIVLDSLKSIMNGRSGDKPIAISDIVSGCDLATERLAEGREKDFKTLLSPKRVGSLLRSMGFVPVRKSSGFHLIVDDAFRSLLEQKRKQYGLS
jgi:hypothetical protein